MQLNKIKLAGFKSFVDPTIVPIPSKLVAVVGPNGCGKSNIIDAVCWVMGENSAKYLRGESSADVIFNGSSARKPVGQASVELIFDNQDGSIGGEYANYSEISIRRAIVREGDSSYFLNGTRCRRRDIIDLFLGTGLGPRSYSIIGQNMISRIIEAKPEEMRVYLEEAAGVSKYKERRRETENRIGHTKENLARLQDVRSELEKQLSALNRQANAAEKFKILKQEERTIRGQWLAAQWRHLDQDLVHYSLQIQQQETASEAKQTDLLTIQMTLEQQRDSQRLSQEVLQEIQGRYYTVGNDIARLEQDIHHTKERQHQWQNDLNQIEKDYADSHKTLITAQQEFEALRQTDEQLQHALEEAEALTKKDTHHLETVEENMQVWQTTWDEYNQQAANISQTIKVDQTRMDHLEQQLHSIQQRQHKLEQEKTHLDATPLKAELAVLADELQKVGTLTAQQNSELTHTRKEITTLKENQQNAAKQLDKVRNALQRLRGEQASLTALQQTALGQRDQHMNQWLVKHHLNHNLRLAQQVEVEAGWELAVEKVLGPHLQAICVESLAPVIEQVAHLSQGKLCVVTSSTQTDVSNQATTTLLSKVKSSWSLDALLSGIYIAETQTDALKICNNLLPHESVITRDGVWLSATWLQVCREENPAAGVFQREQELKKLAKNIAEQAHTQTQLEQQINSATEQLKSLEKQLQALQKSFNENEASVAKLQAQQKVKQDNLIELQRRAERYQEEHQENKQQLQKIQQELVVVQASHQSATEKLTHDATQRQALLQERDILRQQLQNTREKVDTSKDTVHQLEIQLKTTKSNQINLQQTIARMQTQITSLAERKNHLLQASGNTVSLPDLEAQLTIALSLRLQIEEELQAARATIQSLEHEVQQLESQRQLLEREIAKIRDILETLRLESQSLKVKNETLLEKMQEISCQLSDILPTLSEEITIEMLHQQLEQLTQRITRLGPINLVAIEEQAACAERKTYLDQQYDDLVQGLTTLENAIAKIDKETRTRFKEMFDQVNERFKELFPTVFGGGRAYLELTGDNLLDAGITVMACPPGKRNSTIHLLSGGEKAMTAIALVFSIFHLNPAPFCMLDEVDAPLDDANIGRFCDLVKKMSEKTQFIFISHNKLSIEMGEHLIGVTMHEPGVSRLVSVSVEEAISLAGA